MTDSTNDNLVMMPGIKREEVIGEKDPELTPEERVMKALDGAKDLGFTNVVVIGEDATRRCAIVTTDLDPYGVLGRIAMAQHMMSKTFTGG